jgi:hypothetical protein
MTRKYAVDSNIFITASRKYYPFDIAPGFWKQLIEKGNSSIILIDKIKNEIYRNEDDLSIWLKNNEKSFSVKDSEDLKVIKNYKEIITSVNNSKVYNQYAKDVYANSADSWLCAHSKAYNYFIVTEERYRPNSKNNVKIPNVCEEFNIEYIDLLTFIRQLKIVFN